MQIVSIMFLSTVTLVGGVGANLLPQQQPPVVLAERGLDVRIPPPNPEQYRAIRQPRDWRNPWIDVSNDGYRLRSISVSSGKFVAPADLRRALTDLPVGDWPHGRVAVVQSPSIAPGDEAWIAAMRRNVDTAITILTALDADWWGWPS